MASPPVSLANCLDANQQPASSVRVNRISAYPKIQGADDNPWDYRLAERRGSYTYTLTWRPSATVLG